MNKSAICAALLAAMFLGTSNGYVALWRKGCAQPEMQFPYPVALLPEKDQKALESGIPVSSVEELSRLIEDYLS